MNTFFVSDTHFSHRNILKYCPNRQFQTIEEHDEHIIAEWNKRVTDEDLVFHLGDVVFAHEDRAESILNRLNGSIVLIKGNHDKRILKSERFRARFLDIKDYLEIRLRSSKDQVKAVLFHYPIESWNGAYHGNYHFYGHQHTAWNSGKKPQKRKMDVGVDSNPDLAPWLEQNLLNFLENCA